MTKFRSTQGQTPPSLGREITQFAGTLNDPGYRMEAHFAVGCNAFYRGDFAESLGQCDAGIALYTTDLGRLHARYTGQNSGVTNHCYSAYSLWHLGYPDKARSRIRETVALAEELGHPFSLVFALYHDAFLKQQPLTRPGTLPEWCNTYQGLTEEQIADVEQVILQRTDLMRPSQ